MSHLYPVLGNFSVETRRDAYRACDGAPTRTDVVAGCSSAKNRGRAGAANSTWHTRIPMVMPHQLLLVAMALAAKHGLVYAYTAAGGSGGSVRFAINMTGANEIKNQDDPTATFPPGSMFDVVVPTMTLNYPRYTF